MLSVDYSLERTRVLIDQVPLLKRLTVIVPFHFITEWLRLRPTRECTAVRLENRIVSTSLLLIIIVQSAVAYVYTPITLCGK